MAGALMLPILIAVGDIIGVLDGFLAGVYKLGLSSYSYLDQTWEHLEAGDVVSGLVMAAVFGFITALMGCYQGNNPRGGAQGVGAATTNAVVYASILILTADYALTELLFFDR